MTEYEKDKEIGRKIKKNYDLLLGIGPQVENQSGAFAWIARSRRFLVSLTSARPGSAGEGRSGRQRPRVRFSVFSEQLLRHCGGA